MEPKRALVTGATGYVGGRLVPLLLQKGIQVRCMARQPRQLEGRFDGSLAAPGQLEIAAGDVLNPEALEAALQGVDTAYYLIHAMGSSAKGFEERDKIGAMNFANAAAKAGVRRIIYLGGLGRREEDTSAHLHSRHEVGDVLRAGKVAVTELRAAVIVGAGSASFEMLRSLTEKLPFMLCPKWVNTRTQPIFINDARAYLVGAMECEACGGRILDIGGPDVMTYKEMMLAYAEVRHLKRTIIDVPVLTPHLSAYWVNLMTTIPASIAFPLIEGLRSETIVENDEAQRLLPLPLTPFREAVARALRDTSDAKVPTRWSGATRGQVPRLLDATPPDKTLIRNQQIVETRASAEMLHKATARIGGKVGWYYADFLWEIRGAMDRLIGGAGVRRGRRDPEQVAIGDAIDFWRVEDVTPTRLLLRAEMIVPGRAWLEFQIKELGNDTRQLVQTAYYYPNGILGYAYWYACLPFHVFVFGGMARNIVQWAEKAEPIENQVYANHAA